MKRVALLDTSLASTNFGDSIIVRSALRWLPWLAESVRLPTHRAWRVSEMRAAITQEVAVLVGTNVLGRSMWRRRQWFPMPLDTLLLRGRTILLGVGWGDQSAPLDPVSKALLRTLLMPGWPVAVRDRYTKTQLEASGLAADYVSCPTLWGLTGKLPVRRDETEVVATLTDYRREPAADEYLLRRLAVEFERVLLWPQGQFDAEYLTALRVPATVELLPRTLEAFEQALLGRVYVGTRLHGGIRALQLGVPALIIGVDNRASAIADDTRLPYVERKALPQQFDDALSAMKTQRELELPLATITEWRNRIGNLVFSSS